MTRLNFTGRKHLHITLKDSSTLTRFMDTSILVSCSGNFRFIIRIVVSWIILSRCLRLFLLLLFTFLDTFLCPRFEVDLLGELTKIIELESLHGVIVEIKSLQVDNDCITQFFNVRSSSRIDFSVILLTHILVVTIEMIRFDKQVQCFAKVLLIFYVKLNGKKGLLTLTNIGKFFLCGACLIAN